MEKLCKKCNNHKNYQEIIRGKINSAIAILEQTGIKDNERNNAILILASAIYSIDTEHINGN